jgi:hypothetical protein
MGDSATTTMLGVWAAWNAARDTIFGGLAASGWHTAAMTMRLLVESDLRPAGGIEGAGFDEFRWATACATRGCVAHRGRGRRGAAVAVAPDD